MTDKQLDSQLLLALQCCEPTEYRERNCPNCPLYGKENCHSSLCNMCMEYIIHAKSKSERFARGVDAVCDAVNYLHTLY